MGKPDIAAIVHHIGNCMPTFGAGRTSEYNPITHWMKDKPLMFAMGVDVRAVVEFVLAEAQAANRLNAKKKRPKANAKKGGWPKGKKRGKRNGANA